MGVSKIKYGCQTKKNSSKYKKWESNRIKKTAPEVVAVAVHQYCASSSCATLLFGVVVLLFACRCRVCRLRRRCRSSSCCWSRWRLLCSCSVLFVLAVVCCTFARETRVGLGRVSQTPVAQNFKKKKSAIPPLP